MLTQYQVFFFYLTNNRYNIILGIIRRGVERESVSERKRGKEGGVRERESAEREEVKEDYISQLALQLGQSWSIRFKQLSVDVCFQRSPSMRTLIAMYHYFLFFLTFFLLRTCMGWLALCNHLENMRMEVTPNNSTAGSWKDLWFLMTSWSCHTSG